MAKTEADHNFGHAPRRRGQALALTASALFAAPAQARAFDLSLGAVSQDLVQVTVLAMTAGTAIAALFAFALFLRGNRGDRLAAAQDQLVALRAAHDRSEALLDADDQRTIVWDTPQGPPHIFGGLAERAGAPADKGIFLLFSSWLSRDSAAELEAAIDRLRRLGEAFQISVRSTAGVLLEASGRTSGRRSLVRLRELTGERRSFAELKEQADFVVGEVTALRALTDLIPVPLWRRNRTGRLVWVNSAYVRAVEAASQDAVLSSGVELLPSRTREAIREAERAGGMFRDSATAIVAGERRRLQVQDTGIGEGSIGCAIDVSEVDKLSDELKRTRETNARTLDQLASAVAVFDADGRMLFNNAAYRTIWDLPEGWLATGPEESAILDQLRADRKLPEQVNYRDWRSKHLSAYRGAEAREDWWHLPDGRTLRVVAIPNAAGGMTYIYENVTEQLSLESRLQALLELQGETLDHLSEAVAVFGTDGRLRLFNPVFANIWRMSPARLRGEPHIGEIIADCEGIYADKATWDAIRTAVTDLEHSEEAAGRMQRPDGSVIDYATVVLPEGMTMLTFVDVTDSARIQRVLRERNEALEAAARLKSDFIQHVSYELRSPLQTIIGFSELLSAETAGSLKPQQREYMDHIDSSSRALLALINDILDLATVDAGIMSLDIKETDIAALVASAVEGLRDRLAEQNIKFEIHIPKNIGTFHVDEQRVRQILFNLVANAIRFSNAGGSVRLDGAKRGNWVTFTVTDDGVGIPADVMPSIFSPFEAHASQGRRRGAGLGLSIVKSLVELHGGSVEIRSEEGQGTTATVRLPALPEAAAVAAE